MRIENIQLQNFRIYNGRNNIAFSNPKGKNIALIAGKNGFGKTTFLTSLVWGLYGNLMAQVEDKYRRDIKSAGGYESYLKTLLNKHVLKAHEDGKTETAEFSVELKLVDVMIPSIPCKEVVIRRTYNYSKKKESLTILIDGEENKLTKDVGYEVFINDFILPREIAKFFFFDAEKIVTLAEAKSKNELRSLSKAYSEVLGIKKYEDLKVNLNTLLTKLRREGVSGIHKSQLDEYISREEELETDIEQNLIDQRNLDEEIALYEGRLADIQEKLVREGNVLTLKELQDLKNRQTELKAIHESQKAELKKLMDVIPLVIAGSRFDALIDQVQVELDIKNASLDKDLLAKEFDQFGEDYLGGVSDFLKDTSLHAQIAEHFKTIVGKRLSNVGQIPTDRILLDFSAETSRSIMAMHKYVQDSFKEQFERIVKSEKSTRQELGRIQKKIRSGEARKDNHLANKLRADKEELDGKLAPLVKKELELAESLGGLKTKHDSAKKVRTEYEKKYTLIETDKQKYNVTLDLLEKLNILISRIKEEKKYSLQKSIQLGLRKLMHKDDLVTNVKVRIEEDVMDIDLIDQHGNIIDKDTLSKGEQQLYATALLKALVDESGIDFPVFIDSPLQKFDKEHSSNVIQQFYPTISDQVVLFPLLEKELSTTEYEQLKPNLNGVYLIDNAPEGSSIATCNIADLFTKFNTQNHVLAH